MAKTVGEGIVQGLKNYREFKKSDTDASKTILLINALQRMAAREAPSPSEEFIRDPATGRLYRKSVPKTLNPLTQAKLEEAVLTGKFYEYGQPRDVPDPVRRTLASRFGYEPYEEERTRPGFKIGSFAFGQRPTKVGFRKLISPQIDIPAADGSPQFLDPFELEAQQAIAQGADPQLVRERLNQLRTRRGSF